VIESPRRETREESDDIALRELPRSSAQPRGEHILAINLPVDGQDGVVLFQRREKRPSARYLLRELFD
jgi:hypothetical protein